MRVPFLPVRPLQLALVLCGLTVLWNVVVGGAAVVTAISIGSLSLIGFGINAVVDSSVSSLLVWRFRAEGAGHAERAARAEHIALRVAGVAFLVVAVYLVVEASRALVGANHPEASLFGIVQAIASLVVLPFLAARKYTLSRRLISPALRADALLTLSGATLAAVTLGALLLARWFGWSWADAIGALGIAAILAFQGSRSVRGK